MRTLTENEVHQISGAWEFNHYAVAGGSLGATLGTYVGYGFGPIGAAVAAGIGTYVGTYAGSVFDNGDEVIRWSKDPNTWINRYGHSWRDTILNNYYETGELME